MAEILFVVLLAGGMLGAGVYFGLKTKHWHLLGVFVTFFACFGLWEWFAIRSTGMSISQQLWEFGETNPAGLWGIVGALLVAWLALLYHFVQKRLRR